MVIALPRVFRCGVKNLLEFDNLDNYLLVVKEEWRQKDDQR